MSSTAASPARASGTSGARSVSRWTVWRARLESPTTTYYLLLSVTAVLVTIGLVMVLSASMIVSIKDTADGSPYSIFLDQLKFAAIGASVMAVAARMSVRRWKHLAVPSLVVAISMQLLVFSPLGVGHQGNRNWIDLQVFYLQPSEVGKVALVLFGAAVLTRKRPLLGRFQHAVVPYVVPCAVVVITLVMMGKDLGTVLVLGAITAGVLFAAGMRARYFLLGGVLAGAFVATAVRDSSNRMARISIWLDSSQCDPYGICRQPLHGRYALADGGWLGVGLGASREKWLYLPEPHNDFIFAIIGEELGLPGTFVILGLFAVLALACYRLVLRTDDFFVRLATAGIMTWIVVQALINIGAVIGMLPVIGVPLPFVSSGGSSLVTTMLAAGMLLSFARAEPGCARALAQRPLSVRRSLAVLPRRRGRP